MRMRCSHCGAKQHADERQFADARSSQVTCWMCTRPLGVDLSPSDPAPHTIAIRLSVPHAKSGDSRLRGSVDSETASLMLPRDKTINLAVISGPSQGIKCDLSRPLITIGRLGGGADIEIDDPEVSRLHCSVEVRRDAIFLTDLRSTNGTYLGDTRVFGARLYEMSIFRIGSSLLQVGVVSTAEGGCI